MKCGFYPLLFFLCIYCNVFRQFQHENLVKLYGVCTKQGPIFIVQELMVNGKLEKKLLTRMYIVHFKLISLPVIHKM